MERWKAKLWYDCEGPKDPMTISASTGCELLRNWIGRSFWVCQAPHQPEVHACFYLKSLTTSTLDLPLSFTVKGYEISRPVFGSFRSKKA